jgi:uncharacterized protein YfaS (alpha-2-macroglobulin family)
MNESTDPGTPRPDEGAAAPATPAAPAASEAPRAGLGRRVLGDVAWQPPGWWTAARARVARHPGRWLGGTLVALALGAFGAGIALREPPPAPDAVTVEITAPAATRYAETPAVVAPLQVRFSAPVAPLAVIGAPGERAEEPRGLSLRPEVAGTWTWIDDRQLAFAPAEDWPVGRRIELRIDVREALAPGVVLAEGERAFDTAPFAATIASQEFYQDPEDPAQKRGVYTLAFSHPVDAGTLEPRLVLAARDGAGRELLTPAHAVRYDERRLQAWVQSAPLDLPENGGGLELRIAEGVKSTLGGDGAKAAAARVPLPALYSVALDRLEATLVDNARHEPEQVLVLSFNQALRERDVAAGLEVWLLPERRLAAPGETEPPGGWPVPYPWSEGQVDDALLARAERLPLEPLPGEREWSTVHSARYGAPPGRRLFVRVAGGLRSFGGFVLGQRQQRLLQVPDYPQLLQFVGDGALLSLRGERRVTFVARNIPAVRMEVARVLPEQLHHLVAENSGRYAQPQLWSFSEDALVERSERRIVLPSGDPARAQYEGVDLGDELSPSRRGVFLLSLRELGEQDAALPPEQTLAQDAGWERDRRLVVLTDLGVIAKRELDGRRQVFVQSLSGGGAVAGARVRVIARNGAALVEAITDAGGRAMLPDIDGFTRERRAVMLTVSAGSDLSFLPLGDWSRTLDTSRFDVGGEANADDPGQLRALLFSDRGLYRPGEQVHLGLVLRAADWARSPAGLPMELVVTDPTGTVTRRERVRFGDDGFAEAAFTPAESAATGPWQAALFALGEDDRRTWVGETTVQVRDFQPDTLRVGLRLSSENPAGWVHPDALEARVAVENLFGTPAQDRRVEGRLTLRPVLPSFAGWAGFRFHDPRAVRDGVAEPLQEARTDAEGRAVLPLGLERYERATYQLDLLVRAFEPGSGRGVAATTSALVSEAEWLLGLRTPDPMDWIQRGQAREVELVAIGRDGAAIARDGLRAVRVERRHVSVLTRSDDGLFRYVSQLRREVRDDAPLALRAGPQRLRLDTSTPGDFTLELRDADGAVLNSVDYTVAGEADLSRSLDRNAELAITLDKASYAPGEEIQLSLRAPYAGRGLITIERDRVYAHAWFEADTTSSVQRIRLPEGLEGNAYVSVQYLRDPGSDEIYMSPLSWGIAPFAIDREARTLGVRIDAPATARPGQEVALRVSTDEPARVVVFAVDEGILQVAGYRVGQPLDHFLRKRMHQVRTQQILDLLLPEFSRLVAMAAPGGDGAGGAGRHLNPFKRRGEAPAVWWSGIVEVDGERTLRYAMPDHFNGELRLVAVAVNPGRVGLAEGRQRIRGDFVLTPTLPTHLAPGDVFELPVGISNTTEGAGDAAVPVALALDLPEGLALEGDAPAPLSLAPGDEGTVRVRLRVGAEPGTRAIGLRASSGGRSAARRIEVSVRPALVAESTLGVARVERRTAVEGVRDMHDAFATRQLSASVSPLVAVDGLAAWLDAYPHACTEQLLSRGLPGLVAASRPEFASAGTPTGTSLAGLFDVLRTRQNAEGGIGYWNASLMADPFITGYAALAMVEARERGQRVPDDLLEASNRWLAAHAADASLTSMYALRTRALATYLLARQGQSVGGLLAGVQAQLERDQPQRWREDTAGLLVASTYALLRQDAAARPLAAIQLRLAREAAVGGDVFAEFRDPRVDHAWRVYLLHRHFPREAAGLPAAAVEALLGAVRDGRYNTLSVAMTVLALDAAGGADGAARPTLERALAEGAPAPFGEARGLLVRGTFEAAHRRLWVTPGEGAPAWMVLAQAGFDRVAPPAVQDRGLELVRDYLDAEGRPLAGPVRQGDELVVRLRLRSRGEATYEDIAIVDLLPGGAELVLQPPAAGEAGATDADAAREAAADAGYEGYEGDEYAGEGEGGDAPPVPQAPVLALPGSTLALQHAEMREDRVVLYAMATPEVGELRYRIRVASAGDFALPQAHAESMYRRDVIARGPDAGRLVVLPAAE